MENLPETLLEATRYFADLDVCRDFIVMWRWPEGVTCPHCKRESKIQHTQVMFLKTRKIWKCKVCRKQFSIKTGTIFEDSPLPLDKWLIATWIMVNAKNGSSSCEIARALGVTQKTAWFMLHRIRRAMKAGSLDKMEGTIEVDETFVGGLEKNKHANKKRHAGRGGAGKEIVLGVLKRGNGTKDELGRRRRQEERVFSQVQAVVIRDTSHITLKTEIMQRVEEGAELFTDAHRGYRGLETVYQHAFIDHAVKYAEGRVTTNGIENFWSLLDRCIHGTYIRPEAQHLFRYVDEQAFRFNHRGGTDLTRFIEVLRQVKDKRLTYEELTTDHLQYIISK